MRCKILIIPKSHKITYGLSKEEDIQNYVSNKSEVTESSIDKDSYLN